MPSGSCDSHAHIVGPHTQYDLPTTARAVPPEAPLSDYEDMLRALGIQRGVLVQPSVYGTDNSLLLDALARHSATLRGIAIVDFESTTKEQLRSLRESGVRGLRFNTRGSSATSAGTSPPVSFDTIRSIAPLLADSGMHAQLLLVADKLLSAFDELQGLPVDVVIDHIGYVDPRNGVDSPGVKMLLRWLDTGRCWIKLSAPYRCTSIGLRYASMTPIVQRLVGAVPERVLWASDWPHSAAFPPGSQIPNDGRLLDLLAEWAPDENTRQRILVDNPARLYGFGRPGVNDHE